MPKSILGKWSVGLIIAFFLLLIIFFIIAASGQHGGPTLMTSLALAIPLFLAGLSAIASFVTGIVSIIKKERSVWVFLATIIGFLVLLFLLAEILFPH